MDNERTSMEAQTAVLIACILVLLMALFVSLCQPRKPRQTWTRPITLPCNNEALLAATNAAANRLEAVARRIEAGSHCAVRQAAEATRAKINALQPLPGTQVKPKPRPRRAPETKRR
jgi:hypothetical protein